MSQPPLIPPARSEPLDYASSAQRPERPGLVTAIGIISICLGSLAILANCASPMQAIMFSYTTNIGGTSGTLTALPPATQPAPLNDAQIAVVVTHIQKLSGGILNSAQQESLRKALSSPTQEIITPASTSQAITSQILSAGTDSLGSINIVTYNASAEIQPSGAVSMATGVFKKAGSPTAALANFTTFLHSRSYLLMTGVLGAMNFMLGGYLLIIGIMTLRGSRSGARLHRIYAWIKIVLAICGALLVVWLIRQVAVPSSSSAIYQMGFTGGLIIAGMLSAVIGMIYPVALLITLRTRSLRAFYQGVGGRGKQL